MTAELTVGIDIGTTSVKAVAADGDGTVVARARVPHRLLVPAPDQLEHDAVEAWAEGPAKALAALGVDAPRAVAVSAMVPSMTAVDDAGRPVLPGLLYGDGRGRHERSKSSAAPIGEAAEFVRWCAGQAPSARGYWSAPAVANYALAGEAVVDIGVAFTTNPLYGSDMAWDQAVLDRIGARADQMPRVEMMGSAIGRVGGGDTVLAAGSVDAMAEQIVAGAGRGPAGGVRGGRRRHPPSARAGRFRGHPHRRHGWRHAGRPVDAGAGRLHRPARARRRCPRGRGARRRVPRPPSGRARDVDDRRGPVGVDRPHRRAVARVRRSRQRAL